jgi:hypothetical protein
MSTTMSDNTITVREFRCGDVNFIANDDLGHELREGGNNEAGYSVHSDHVLVTINVDDCEFSSVQVSARHSETYLAAIEASIESLIVIRDQLRSMTVAA